MKLTIREESNSDCKFIEKLTVAAFKNVEYSDHAEQHIINALRSNNALCISLVAELEGKIVGHVALSAVTISDGADHWFGLGPISVDPQRQNLGIGSQLMNAALEALTKINAYGCVLLGEPVFYTRFGFRVVKGLTLEGVPAEYFLALILQGKPAQGQVEYHFAFNSES